MPVPIGRLFERDACELGQFLDHRIERLGAEFGVDQQRTAARHRGQRRAIAFGGRRRSGFTGRRNPWAGMISLMCSIFGRRPARCPAAEGFFNPFHAARQRLDVCRQALPIERLAFDGADLGSGRQAQCAWLGGQRRLQIIGVSPG